MSLINRRHWMKTAAIGIGGASVCGWLPAFAQRVADDPQRRRHCILLWMSGGPSQTDTFDMKPGHANGGEFKEIATRAPGVRFTEHLPQLAAHADKLAIVRSLSTKEGDHARGTFLMRTGQRPMGPITYPAITCALAKALGSDDDPLPRCVSVAPYQALSREAFGPGFLGPKYMPLVVGASANPAAIASAAPNGFTELKIEALQPPADISSEQLARRRQLWSTFQSDFVARHGDGAASAHQTVYQRSMDMMTSQSAEAFDLTKEPAALRESYGKGVFGQGCLMARRLVERGVPVVEVSLGYSSAGGHSWDTHSNNFEALKVMLAELDAGWATLMQDLEERGLLESTTILWMGEFGRTPKINASAGRDHFPAAWSCVFGGGGIAGGQVYGRTSADGNRVEENPVNASDILATLVKAVGVSPSTENQSNVGRPIKLVEGQPIAALLT